MAKTWFWILAISVCVILSGCRSISSSGIFDRHDRVLLKFSNSADVLAVIHPEESELLSQSESVVASWGSNKKISKLWFNAIAFDEELLTATRKYCFIANEKAKGYYVAPAEKLRFDAEVVLGPEVLDEPYANENAKRIAILQHVLTVFSEDMIQVTPDSRTLESATLMAKQVLNSILREKFEQSPALAARLTEPDGVKFEHRSLGAGLGRMIVEGDVAKVRIKVGKGGFKRPLTLQETPKGD